MNLNECNNDADETLARRFKAGDKKAGTELARRYIPLVKKLCRLHGSNDLSDDLEQELWCAFVELTLAYDEGRAKFSTMASAMLRGKRKAFLRKGYALKAEETSLEESVTGLSILDVSPLLADWEYRELKESIAASPEQMRILSLMEDGYRSSAAIARILGVAQPVIFRKLAKMRERAKKLVFEGV